MRQKCDWKVIDDKEEKIWLLTVLSNYDDSLTVIDHLSFSYGSDLGKFLGKGPVRRELDAEKYGMKLWGSTLIPERMWSEGQGGGFSFEKRDTVSFQNREEGVMARGIGRSVGIGE